MFEPTVVPVHVRNTTPNPIRLHTLTEIGTDAAGRAVYVNGWLTVPPNEIAIAHVRKPVQ